MTKKPYLARMRRKLIREYRSPMAWGTGGGYIGTGRNKGRLEPLEWKSIKWHYARATESWDDAFGHYRHKLHALGEIPIAARRELDRLGVFPPPKPVTVSLSIDTTHFSDGIRKLANALRALDVSERRNRGPGFFLPRPRGDDA